jgi:hypothetical protein
MRMTKALLRGCCHVIVLPYMNNSATRRNPTTPRQEYVSEPTFTTALFPFRELSPWARVMDHLTFA